MTRAKTRPWMLVALAAMALALPRVADSYTAYILNSIGIYAIAGIGLNLATGFTGLTSLGHAAFFAVGAYAAGILVATYHWPFLAAMPVAGLAAVAVGVLSAAPVVRLQGHYLGISTLALALIVQQILYEAEGITGGRSGLPVPRPKILGWSLSDDRDFYYLILATLAICVIVARIVTSSHLGRAWRAVKDSEIAAQTGGIDLARTKVQAFLFSAFYAGVSGSLFAPLIRHLSVDNFGLLLSAAFLTMIVIGGLGSHVGSILGAAYIVLMPEVFRDLKEAQMILYGVALIVVMLYLPKGLAGVPDLILSRRGRGAANQAAAAGQSMTTDRRDPAPAGEPRS